MNAEELVRFAAKQAEKIFKRSGRVVWMYHYLTEDGRHGLLSPRPPCSKDQIAELARMTFKAERAVAYVLMNEIWTVIGITDAEREEQVKVYGGSLENVPGREEAIMLMGEDANGMVLGRMTINRPQGHEPYLSPLVIEPVGQIEGRLVGLLPQRGTVQ